MEADVGGRDKVGSAPLLEVEARDRRAAVAEQRKRNLPVA